MYVLAVASLLPFCSSPLFVKSFLLAPTPDACSGVGKGVLGLWHSISLDEGPAMASSKKVSSDGLSCSSSSETRSFCAFKNGIFDNIWNRLTFDSNLKKPSVFCLWWRYAAPGYNYWVQTQNQHKNKLASFVRVRGHTHLDILWMSLLVCGDCGPGWSRCHRVSCSVP